MCDGKRNVVVCCRGREERRAPPLWRRKRTAAAALYRRNGFHPTGVPGDLMPDGMHREQIMAKTLQ